MPIVGPSLRSPFFPEEHVEPSITLQHLLIGAPARRVQLCRQLRSQAASDPVAARAAVSKTQAEVAAHVMSGPFTATALTTKHGAHWNPCRRFAIQQGCQLDGSPKFRVIDDHSANDNNKTTGKVQKLRMSSVSTLMLMIKSMARHLQQHQHDTAVLVSTDDMKAAYRQVPVSDSSLSCAIAALFNPDTGIEYYELFGQPFGASNAVDNFYRVAHWLATVARRYFHLAVDHFFDDFFLVEPASSASFAPHCLHQLFELLGLSLDPQKSQPPT
eukprot:6302924-Amphidinium_carterae.1